MVFELQTQFETGHYEFVTALISPLPLPPLFNVYTATTNMEGTGRAAKKKDTQKSKEKRSTGRKVYKYNTAHEKHTSQRRLQLAVGIVIETENSSKTYVG